MVEPQRKNSLRGYSFRYLQFKSTKCQFGRVCKSGEKWGKVSKSGQKWATEFKEGQKGQKFGKSGQKHVKKGKKGKSVQNYEKVWQKCSKLFKSVQS